MIANNPLQSNLPANNSITQKYTIEIQFDRGNATYKPQQIVSGNIILQCKVAQHYKLDLSSLSISVKGLVSPYAKHNNKNIESISSKIKPINIISIESMELAKNKTINENTKIPFRFKLQKKQNRYIQTYFGVYINVTYNIQVKAILSQGALNQQIPFYIIVPKAGRQAIDKFQYPKKKHFLVRSQDIKSQSGNIPKFKIKGQFQSQIIYFADDLNGTITVETADSPIRSIDLQMLRVQKIQTGSEKFNEKTQIQMIQICDGNVTRNLQIPVYMILPRYYSCPSIKEQWCSVDFEMDLKQPVISRQN